MGKLSLDEFQKEIKKLDGGDIMKGVSVLDIGEEDAEKSYKDYLEAVKGRKEKYLEDLKKVYYNLKQGRKVIDVFKAMETAGVNEKGEPRLAISRAGFAHVVFRKQAVGSGTFGSNFNESWGGFEGLASEQVILPSGTFPNWEMKKDSEGKSSTWDILKDKIKTKVPVIPAHLLPNGKLESYYLLWEAKEWDELPQTKDPFLLRRLSSNLFVVLAEWELTAIEQAVIRGLE